MHSAMVWKWLPLEQYSRFAESGSEGSRAHCSPGWHLRALRNAPGPVTMADGKINTNRKGVHYSKRASSWVPSNCAITGKSTWFLVLFFVHPSNKKVGVNLHLLLQYWHKQLKHFLSYIKGFRTCFRRFLGWKDLLMKHFWRYPSFLKKSVYIVVI